MTAQETVRRTATTAAATGLWCVASVSAMRHMLANAARGPLTSSCHQMKIVVAQAQTPLFAAIGEYVLRVSVSVRPEKTQKKYIREATASATTLNVHTGTTGIICNN